MGKDDSLTYDDVFADVNAPDFPQKLNNWMESRFSGNLSELSEGENTLLQIRFALMDINGNSFPGFFESPPDDRLHVFVDALNAIGAHRSAEAIVRIGEMLFDGPIPETLDERSDALVFEDDDASDAFDQKLDDCYPIWDETGDDFPSLMLKYATENPSRFRK